MFGIGALTGSSGHLVSATNDRRSAYRRRRATVAYRWRPLFGRTLQVSHNRRGRDLTCVYTDERPNLARELRNWMSTAAEKSAIGAARFQATPSAMFEAAASEARPHGAVANERPLQRCA